MSNFTKGEWKMKGPSIGDGEPDYCIYIELEGKPQIIAEVFGRSDWTVTHSSKENAWLMKAAPHMLAALIATEKERSDMGEEAPLDPGCVLCTHNTTPHNRDTGLCAHHLRVRAIIEATEGVP